MTLPTIQATGNLVADPQLRFTPKGKAVTTITIACNDRRKSATGEWTDTDTTYLEVQLWETDAEQAAEHLTKGQRVTVTGKLRQRSYEAKDGTIRRAYEVIYASVAVALPRDPRPMPLPADDTPPF